MIVSSCLQTDRIPFKDIVKSITENHTYIYQEKRIAIKIRRSYKSLINKAKENVNTDICGKDVPKSLRSRLRVLHLRVQKLELEVTLSGTLNLTR